MRRRWLLFLTLMIIGISLKAQTVRLENAFPHLSFFEPVFLTQSGDGSNRLFAVQQNGFIESFLNDTSTASAETFLDVSKNLSASDGEEGLLGLAFDPHFSQNGYFYIDYTAPNPLHTVIARYRVSSDNPNKADSLSAFTILTVNQPFTNHNGGMLAFGADGYLYIGFGDGGSGGDPNNNAQNRSQLLGKILRIDVSDTTDTTHYRIPPDNPFAGNNEGYRQEIWAYGLRNPWRFSFDPTTGDLWAGDVGQASREEIDLILPGHNYGWRIMEGTACYNPSSGCDTTGLTMPVIDYTHDLGIAVVGGYVYHGSRRPDLQDDYIYADYGSGRIWMLRYANGQVVSSAELLHSPYVLSSFGVDQHNELYIMSYSTSVNTPILRFADMLSPVGSQGDDNNTPHFAALEQNYPNPFNPTTTIQYTVAGVRRQASGVSEVRMVIYDVLGREVAVLVNGKQVDGTYKVNFDGYNLPSGVYFYRLNVGNWKETKMMLLVR